MGGRSQIAFDMVEWLKLFRLNSSARNSELETDETKTLDRPQTCHDLIGLLGPDDRDGVLRAHLDERKARSASSR